MEMRHAEMHQVEMRHAEMRHAEMRQTGMRQVKPHHEDDGLAPLLRAGSWSRRAVNSTVHSR